ncbi:MAG TPA: hypothetical protein VGM88_33935 [Kofleriaceae bacterium]|jgi:hypothetical protein
MGGEDERSGARNEIDRLIEDGLARYGQGDVDGALEAWEQVLSVEPENAQASSYVDYVRDNYETLTTDGSAVPDSTFPFADEPEYQIEISPGEVSPAKAAPLFMDPLDEGWVIAAEMGREPTRPTEISVVAPMPVAPAPTFDDQTREYPAGKPAQDLLVFETATNEFSTQTTDVRQRDLGFVQPREAPMPKKEDKEQPPPQQPSAAASAIGELELDLAPYAGAGTGSDPEIEIERGLPELELDDGPLGSLAQPIRPSTTRPLPAQTRPPAADSSPPPPSRSRTPSPHTVSRTTSPLHQTLPALPPVLRPPAQVPTQELPIDSNARTREIPALQQVTELAQPPSVTRDFSEKPTTQVPSRAFALDPNIISQPTRDLGLRPPGATAAVVTKRPPRPPSEDDREEITTTRQPPIRDPQAGIDTDVARILESIEQDAPADEPKDERTRRRITALLERAAQWTRGGELARAVTAVDLALSEDPNSALAQKLVHRNRDTITAAFVGFLGDLNRAPTLARPLHELAHAPISPRAAFLLSRIDGTLSLDEILDVSGMPRLEAYRYLCQLLLRGILR